VVAKAKAMRIFTAIQNQARHFMKSKLIITALIIVAGLGGFWFGNFRTAAIWRGYLVTQLYGDAHRDALNRAKVNLQLLIYLHDGEQSKATDLLERQLDVALCSCAAHCKTVPPPELVGDDIWTIRQARDYRSRHPWTNDPVRAEYLKSIFEWAK
jgi:hypothetical protein